MMACGLLLMPCAFLKDLHMVSSLSFWNGIGKKSSQQEIQYYIPDILIIILPYSYSTCGYQCRHSWILLFTFHGMGIYSSVFWN